MSQHLADLMPAGAAPGGLRLWLKSSAYSRQLLLGPGDDPWLSPSAYLAHFAQARGLLKPDVAVIEVGELFASWLRRHPALAVEMASRRKLSYPLRRLLEQAGARALLAEIIEAVLANLGGQLPLVLAMPSPRRWLLQANGDAGRRACEADRDSIEDAAMYMADLVRSVSGFAVGALLFEEAQDDGVGADLELYRPMINVARHYRWPLALRAGPGGIADGAAAAEFDVFINGGTRTAAAIGIDLGRWPSADAPAPPLAARQFYFVEIEAGAMPEQVLDKLASLRAGA